MHIGQFWRELNLPGSATHAVGRIALLLRRLWLLLLVIVDKNNRRCPASIMKRNGPCRRRTFQPMKWYDGLTDWLPIVTLHLSERTDAWIIVNGAQTRGTSQSWTLSQAKRQRLQFTRLNVLVVEKKTVKQTQPLPPRRNQPWTLFRYIPLIN